MSVYLVTDPNWMALPIMAAFSLGVIVVSVLILVAFIWAAHAVAVFTARRNSR